MVKICPQQWSEPDLPEFGQYSYELSPFQKYAIQGIIKGHHILVTAHTGSGKTLPAEFAINHLVAQGKKVIYTSPIKALSNQKYYHFAQSYPHISFGLLTGDIKINPTAQVLLMTTEILMNYLLFRDSCPPTYEMDLLTVQHQLNFTISMDELAAVVFDEVHYINDRDRGQNWEKTLILLPPQVQRIMLSATIHSPEVFAQWNEDVSGAKTADKEVWICSSKTRVVPLKHFAFIAVPQAIYKSGKPPATPREGKLKPQPSSKTINRTNKPELTKAQETELKQAVGNLLPISVLGTAPNSGAAQFDETYRTLNLARNLIKQTRTTVTRPFVLNHIMGQLKAQDMLPAIAFSFSRKKVEEFAQEITVPLLEDDSKIPYTAKREAEQIVRRLPNCQEYLKLPEYLTLVKLLEKGIGIHHSGMIPVLREIVELMISQKKIKLLFATESFAIGLDCPIRTVVFTDIYKFDGSTERILMPHEYTQMAGRAGRRGIDIVGYVVHCNNLFDLPSKSEYLQLISGKTQILKSKFRISYDLPLSLLAADSAAASTGTPMSERGAVGKSLDELCEFASNSMLKLDIRNIHCQLVDEINSVDCAIQEKQRLFVAKCPHGHHETYLNDFCRRFIALKQAEKTAVNKKRRDIERELSELHQSFNEAFTANLSLETLAVEFAHMHEQIENKHKLEEQLCVLDKSITQQMQQVLDVLVERGFVHVSVVPDVSHVCSSVPLTVCQDQTQIHKYFIQPLGQIAAHLSEFPALLFAQALPQLKCLNTTDWILLMSCFVNVRVKEEDDAANSQKQGGFTAADSLLQLSTTLYEEFKPQIEYYRATELSRGINSGIFYDELAQPILAPLLLHWIGCETEEDCKWVLQMHLPSSVSIGDFNKAVLKIIAMAKQLESTLTEFPGGNHEWLEIISALSLVEKYLAKYVITCQSLYV